MSPVKPKQGQNQYKLDHFEHFEHYECSTVTAVQLDTFQINYLNGTLGNQVGIFTYRVPQKSGYEIEQKLMKMLVCLNPCEFFFIQQWASFGSYL